MRKLILRFYLTVKKPRNFLKIVCTYIATSVLLHWFRGYDADWGGTNLIMSIEATIGQTVMLMVQEEGNERQKQMLEALVSMAEAQRDMLADHAALLRTLREGDAQILETLTEIKEE